MATLRSPAFTGLNKANPKMCPGWWFRLPGVFVHHLGGMSVESLVNNGIHPGRLTAGT